MEGEPMPLTMLDEGKTATVVGVTGETGTKAFLEKLGLVSGTPVSVVSRNRAGVIVSVKGSRIALGREMAGKVLV